MMDKQEPWRAIILRWRLANPEAFRAMLLRNPNVTPEEILEQLAAVRRAA